MFIFFTIFIFLQTDPFSTASDVSDADRDKYKKQKVFLLEDLLQLAAKHDVVVMFDVRNPVESNPFRNRTMELVIQTLLNSTFNLTKVRGKKTSLVLAILV